MSDFGTCQENLDTLLGMHKESPLTERELEIAVMQFSYTGTQEFLDDVDYSHNKIMRMLNY